MAKFNQGKINILIGLVIAIVVVGGLALNFLYGPSSSPPPEKKELKEGVEAKAVLVIDYGQGSSENLEAEFKEGMTAFDLLEEKAKEIGLNLEVKTYDMGVFIERIGEKKNGDDGKYWLYYLNGEMPMVSADKQALNPGDKVEFKFEKSSF